MVYEKKGAACTPVSLTVRSAKYMFSLQKGDFAAFILSSPHSDKTQSKIIYWQSPVNFNKRDSGKRGECSKYILSYKLGDQICLTAWIGLLRNQGISDIAAE